MKSAQDSHDHKEHGARTLPTGSTPSPDKHTDSEQDDGDGQNDPVPLWAVQRESINQMPNAVPKNRVHHESFVTSPPNVNGWTIRTESSSDARCPYTSRARLFPLSTVSVSGVYP